MSRWFLLPVPSQCQPEGILLASLSHCIEPPLFLKLCSWYFSLWLWEEVCSKGELVTRLHPVIVEGNSRVQLLQAGRFLNV